MRYAIFTVSDYKGGELHTNVNLSYKRFIDELVELFDNVELDPAGEVEGDYSDYVYSEIRKHMKRDFYSTYAGGDGFCGELFKIEGDRMISTSIEEHMNDIVKKIVQNPSR